MATLGLKEMGKFLWPCWLSQFSFDKFVWKMQKKKSGIMKSGVDAMPLFLLDDLLKQFFPIICGKKFLKTRFL